MPITHNNLWNQIVTFENLFKAYVAAARGRRYKDSVLGYRQHLEENIINTLNLLISKQWQPSRFREFYIHDPKKRLISAPPFKDRVVHHALAQVVAPLFERKFIADSFACQVNKGTHAAKQQVEAFTETAHRQWGGYYVLKGDIRAYFYSINRKTLLELIERTISDRDVLWLIKRIVECDDNQQGIPIGALTSQLFANMYLDTMDHYLKDDLGVKMYTRYMDDFVVIHPDKEYLRKLLVNIETFITNRLQLTLNPKTAILKSGASVCHAVDFCGYRIRPGCIKPRKRNVKAARKRFKKLSELYRKDKIELSRLSASIASFTGYMKHCNGKAILESVLSGVILNKDYRKQNSANN